MAMVNTVDSWNIKSLMLLCVYVIVATCVLFIFVTELGDIRTSKTICFGWNKHYLILEMYAVNTRWAHVHEHLHTGTGVHIPHVLDI